MKKISVVIPSYNRRNLLGGTLDSLRAQTYSSSGFEVVVVDNGSTDGTGEMVEAFGEAAGFDLRYVRTEEKGISLARNLGVKKADSPIIAFIDSDARADPGWLSEYMGVYGLDEIQVGGDIIPQKKIGGLGGRILISNPENKIALYSEVGRYRPFGAEQREEMYISPPHAHSTTNMSWKKKVIKEAGFFDEGLYMNSGEDNDMGLKVSDLGYSHIFCPKALVYHNHPDSLGRLLARWYRNGRTQVLVSRELGGYRMNSPFRPISREFATKYWYLLPVDFLVRASLAAGIISGLLTL